MTVRRGRRGGTISGLLDEAGRIVESGLLRLRDMMRAQLRRLPALYHGRRLDDDLVWEYVHEFYLDRWPRLSAAILSEAEDDGEVAERIAKRSIRNWLIDRVRRTDRGHAYRRVEDVLRECETFQAVPVGEVGEGRWRLAGTRQGPWGGRLEDLVHAAYAVNIAAVRWEKTDRRSPIAATPDLITLLEAVMIAAEYHSLELQQLVAVVVRRFPATLDPDVDGLDDAVLGEYEQVADTALSADRAYADRQELLDRAETAETVFRQLTEQERQLLPLLHDVAAVQKLLGCGRSTAYTRIGRLKALIRELLGSQENPGAVVQEVLDLCAR